MTGHVAVKRPDAEPAYGFNIVSLGLDAYVAYLTNRLRGKVGGDAYKVLADAMTLFYERIVRLRDSRVTWTTADTESETLEGRIVVCAVGVSGFRTYGDHKPILPGFENVCLIETTGPLGKIKLKAMVYNGTHSRRPEVHMASASAVRFDYDGRLPLQFDGEAVWLTADSFPVTLEVVPDSVPVLQMKS